MSLSVTAIKLCSVLLNVILRAAANEIIELALVHAPKLDALAARAHVHSLHHGAVKLHSLLRRSRVNRHIRLCADHPARYVVAHRPHRYCATLCVRQDHASDWHAVAVMSVGCDDDQLNAWKACGVYYLAIEYLFGVVEKHWREKQPDGHVRSVFRLKIVVTIPMPACKVFPVVSVL